MLLGVCCFVPCVAARTPLPSNIICRPELARTEREHLALKLRRITGWSSLGFDDEGNLLIGGDAVGGSRIARELLIAAGQVRDVMVLEDASRRDDVVFARVVPGVWARDAELKPPVHIVKIDFADFKHLRGDRAARDAFDPGWALLHEVAHVVHKFDDTERLDDLGECERFVNSMRGECDLAERAEYFYTFVPNLERSEHKQRLVRLAFTARSLAAGDRKHRHWLLWDAALVGGADPAQGHASTRLKPRP